MDATFPSDPPSRHATAPDTAEVTQHLTKAILSILRPPVAVSGPTYTRPPMWFTPPCVDPVEVRLRAQRMANESGMVQRVTEMGTVTEYEPER